MNNGQRRIIPFDEGWFQEDQLSEGQRAMMDLPKPPQSAMSFVPRDPGQSPTRRLKRALRRFVLDLRVLAAYILTGWGPY